ncbi:MAG: single-stranded DNA-binding protein [Chloroflexi bacterium]|nr:single-stranded DNA-binding protein [Chloroflexota bacterium]
MPLFVNNVQLAGNLTRDPEVRFFANERAVANFGLAINRRYKGSDGETKEEVTFITVTAWGRTAELVGQYLTKGRNCYIEGRLQLDQWEDKKTGEKRSALKVLADTVQFIGHEKPSDEDRDHVGLNRNGLAPGERRPAQRAATPARPPVGIPQDFGDLGDDEPPF